MCTTLIRSTKLTGSTNKLFHNPETKKDSKSSNFVLCSDVYVHVGYRIFPVSDLVPFKTAQ